MPKFTRNEMSLEEFDKLFESAQKLGQVGPGRSEGNSELYHARKSSRRVHPCEKRKACIDGNSH